MKKVKIGGVILKSNVVLAPMAGFSDSALRYLSYSYGAGLVCTEMVSAKSLQYGNKKSEELLCEYADIHPRAVQIFGHDPICMAAACQNPLLAGYDIIDINMGCPTPKIVKNGDGSALISNIDLARQIIEACVAATDKPITVKFRLGVNGDHIVAEEFAKMCEAAGAAAITVHGRMVEQGYSGRADWQAIAKVVQSVNIPVFANGDCTDKHSYQQMLKVTGAAGVMVGRAAIGCPEIFAILQGKNPKIDKLEQIKQHIQILGQLYAPKQVLLNMRGIACHYVKSLPNTASLRTRLCKAASIDEMLSLLEEYFAKRG